MTIFLGNLWRRRKYDHHSGSGFKFVQRLENFKKWNEFSNKLDSFPRG